MSVAQETNHQGQIVGTGGAGGTKAFLLTPIDVPVGDLDIDCQVDHSDLVILLDAWGQTDSRADLDLDGNIGVSDLLILLANWS